METTKRFDNAVMKLYNAFHENRLNGLDCSACAVGNLLNNNEDWANIFSFGRIFAPELKYTTALKEIKKSGYSLIELSEIEIQFLYGTSVEKFDDGDYIEIFSDFKLLKSGDKDRNFKGLCAVVEYLDKLDNIPNPMDYTKLFETENNKPKYQLVQI